MILLMTELPQNLYRASQIRKLDQLAIENYELSADSLMERAGQLAFDVLQQRWPRVSRIAVLCGVGNNGGDGYVVARLAKEAGIEVGVFQVGDEIEVKGAALAAQKALVAKGVAINPYKHGGLASWDVIVDGLFGTGLSREVTGVWHSAIEAINRSEKPVLALDVPSGLNSDTGQAMGLCVDATVTTTFIGVKQGCLTGQGLFHCGELVFDDLSVPEELYSHVPPSARRLNMQYVSSMLGKRMRTAHKGQNGHVLIVGGEEGMSGAARLAAEAAARVGAGLVSIATRKSHAAILSANRPELMSHGIQVIGDFKRLLEKATVVGIGPGLGQSPWAEELFACVMESGLPVVVDADALNLISKDPISHNNWVLTPHPGEAAKLLNTTVEKIQQDRFSAVFDLQQRYGGIAVLKGAGTLVTSGDYSIDLTSAGNPGMATGGMGDLLTGVICGLIAQRLSLKDAAKVGVCIHAEAGDRAARYGERGMLASDLMGHLRHLVNT